VYKRQVVGRGSGAKGHSLGDIDIRKNTGALILAVRRSTGEFNTNPSADTVLTEGDNLVVLGTQDQLDAVRAYV
jgi:voltage-gated potassium channel